LSDPESQLIATVIGRNIRRRRHLAGMTQAELGARLGISFQQLQKYEHGKHQISAANLYRLACIWHCPLDDFLAGLEPGPPAATYPAIAQQRLAGRVTRALLAAGDSALALSILHLLIALSDGRQDPNRPRPPTPPCEPGRSDGASP
jgi:transcriptional regulator with XRE-family HTH domain